MSTYDAQNTQAAQTAHVRGFRETAGITPVVNYNGIPELVYYHIHQRRFKITWFVRVIL